ncbi:MAG: hypothetical protein OEY09_01155 [Gammaproteobacteria bacterium]|nr:hypothetical protein [Gammaproteobacteria bacterium]
MDDDDIPVLTDLIEEKVDKTQPDFDLTTDRDIVFDEGDLLDLTLEADTPSPAVRKPDSLPLNPALEQTIRRILDEHMELAWQEIRLAIQQSQEDND